MMNKDLAMLLKEGKGDKLNLTVDPNNSEKYSFPKSIWDLCKLGLDWLPQIKK